MSGLMNGVRGWVALPLLAMMLGTLPATGGAEDKAKTLKFATIIPRSPRMALELKKRNKDLAERTGGLAKIRVYWGGAAGDEKNVLRKMRARQIDGTGLGLEILSNFVREALVLASPALYVNYKQIDAVRGALVPEFNEEAYRNGFKCLVWGDVGRLRLFSKHKIQTIADFRKVRPWLYPESEMLKVFYKIIGATGVPLGLNEVYGGMQTNMIDTFWGSSVLAGALQWHRTAKYVSPPLGFIQGALIYKRESWDGLAPIVREVMLDMVKKEARKGQRDIRKQDVQAHRKLLKRGYTEVEATNPQEWWDVGHKLRKKMTGRIYTQALVDRAEKIAMKYATEEQLEQFEYMRKKAGK